jgi:hypothetical protein
MPSGVMAYNVWAMKWVSYRYGFRKSDLPQGARAGGGSQSTHTHVGRSTQLDGRTSATSYVQDMRDMVVRGRADVSLCGGCRDRTYCSRACQKEVGLTTARPV